MLGHSEAVVTPFLSGYGDFSEIRNKSSSEGILIQLEKDGNNKISLRLNNDSDFSISRDFIQPVFYVSADRFGPEVNLPTMRKGVLNFNAGERGQYSAHFLHALSETKVPDKIRHIKNDSAGFDIQVNAWIGEISPNSKISTDVSPKHDTSYLEINGHRATNAGFGISYILPIVLMGLALTIEKEINIDASDGILDWLNFFKENYPILIVENPEAHLHPRGQTAMGQFLARVASCGVIVVVETHSDHLIDGIRIAVKNKVLDSEELSVSYLNLDDDGNTQITEIKTNSNGKFDFWPSGFFDQTLVNLRELNKK